MFIKEELKCRPVKNLIIFKNPLKESLHTITFSAIPKISESLCVGVQFIMSSRHCQQLKTNLRMKIIEISKTYIHVEIEI